MEQNETIGHPMTENLEKINEHVCAGCIKVASEQAVAMKVHIESQLDDHEAILRMIHAANEAHANVIIAGCQEHGITDPNVVRGLGFMAAYGQCVNTVDVMCEDNHPLARVAFLAQALRSELYNTVAATVRTAHQEGVATTDDYLRAKEIAAHIMQAIDNPPVDFARFVTLLTGVPAPDDDDDDAPQPDAEADMPDTVITGTEVELREALDTLEGSDIPQVLRDIIRSRIEKMLAAAIAKRPTVVGTPAPDASVEIDITGSDDDEAATVARAMSAAFGIHVDPEFVREAMQDASDNPHGMSVRVLHRPKSE